MIAGRPTNLWLGLVTALAGAVTVSLIAAGIDPTLVANLVGAGVTVLGSVIALVAYQPPTVLPNSDVTVQTPSGRPNATATLGLSGAGEVVVKDGAAGGGG